MKLAVIGATGRVGVRVAAEALARGHQVTGVARHAAAVPAGVALIEADASKPADLASAIAGHDAVIHAGKNLNAADVAATLRQAGVKRLFVVGGAASLKAPDGSLLLDDPGFPEPWKPEARIAKQFLEDLRGVEDLDWTFLSPAALLEPGVRTGHYRQGGDFLLTDAEGNSRISMEDLAIAVIDELEAPKHIRQRFTIAY